jgi:hypothetical protein
MNGVFNMSNPDFEALLKEDILTVYRHVAARLPGYTHGDFLTSFADAVIRADAVNFELLRTPALAFMAKYHLVQELARREEDLSQKLTKETKV